MSKKTHLLDLNIHINCVVRNDVTIATASVDLPIPGAIQKTVQGHGTSKRHPSDRFNEEIGIKLASGRALESLSRRLLRQGSGMVKSLDDSHKEKEKKLELTKALEVSEQLTSHSQSSPSMPNPTQNGNRQQSAFIG